MRATGGVVDCPAIVPPEWFPLPGFWTDAGVSATDGSAGGVSAGNATGVGVGAIPPQAPARDITMTRTTAYRAFMN